MNPNIVDPLAGALAGVGTAAFGTLKIMVGVLVAVAILGALAELTSMRPRNRRRMRP